MVTNIAAISGTLTKEYYIDTIEDHLNNSSTVWALFEKSEDEIAGDNLTSQFLVKKSRNSGMEWLAESANLPDASQIGWVRCSAALKYLYANAIHVTSQSLYATRKSASAFARLIDEQIYDATSGVEIELERASFGDGSGALCLLNQASATIASGTDIGCDGPGVRVLENGLILESFSAKTGGTQESPFDTTNSRDYVTIQNIDFLNNKVQFDTAAAITNNNILFRKGSRGNVMMGLKGLDHAEVSTLQGINRSDGNQEFFRANVIDAGSVALTLENLQSYVEQGNIVGGGTCDLIITSFELRRKYAGIFQADRRYTPRDNLVQGQTVTSYMSGNREIPIYASRFCDASYMYLLDRKSIKYCTAGGIQFISSHDDDSILFREISKDEYRSYLRIWVNMIFKAPNRNTIVKNLAT